MSSLMKDLCIEAEDELRIEIANALSDIGFTDNDAENIADTIEIPWELLNNKTTDKYTAIVDFAHESYKEPC